MAYANSDVDFELPDGRITKFPVCEMILKVFVETCYRDFELHHLLFPPGLKYCYTPKDRRYKRNVNRLRQYFQRIFDERRKGETKGHSEDDLASILIQSDFYRDNDELMIDELIIFYIGGMETISISSANMIYYVTRDA